MRPIKYAKRRTKNGMMNTEDMGTMNMVTLKVMDMKVQLMERMNTHIINPIYSRKKPSWIPMLSS